MAGAEEQLSFAAFSPALPPDCLELLRVPAALASRLPALARVLLCGSYSLDASSGVKTGALELLRLASPAPSAAPVPLLSLAGVGGAVFDARWLGAAAHTDGRRGGKAVTAAAAAAAAGQGADDADKEKYVAHILAVTAAGCLEAHSVLLAGDACGALTARQGPSARLSLRAAGETPTSALSMCSMGDGSTSLAVSRSDGCISLVEAAAPAGFDGSCTGCGDGGEQAAAASLSLSRSWQAHTDASGGGAEVWAVAAPPGPGGAASASMPVPTVSSQL